MENRLSIKGKENMQKVVSILLDSGYSVLTDLDRDSEQMFGYPIYIIEYVRPEFDGKHFSLVD